MCRKRRGKGRYTGLGYKRSSYTIERYKRTSEGGKTPSLIDDMELSPIGSDSVTRIKMQRFGLQNRIQGVKRGGYTGWAPNEEYDTTKPTFNSKEESKEGWI